MQNNNVIEVENLVKKFGSFVANDNLNFSVAKGEVFGFLGANGAGKTTALRILSGLSRPTSGKVMVAGIDVARYPEKVKQNIGYMSQKFSLYEDMTIMENIRFYASIYGIKTKDRKHKEEQLMERLGLAEVKNTRISNLPLGWKQKLAFSLAIFHEPKVVFLDEPTGGVDPLTRRQFWEMIYESAGRGITVFVTTHYMDEAEYCDRLSIMVDGKIVAMDTPTELIKLHKVKNMDEVFLKLAR
jgi:ABC-2 type transport system ATP-binding protein